MRKYLQTIAVSSALAIGVCQMAYSQETKSECSLLEDDFTKTNESYQINKDKKQLKVLYEKAGAIEQRAAKYYAEFELDRAKGLDPYFGDVAMIRYKYCVPRALASLLTTAKNYVDAGIYDVPKQIYRDIITTYTGPAWAPYVKKAEFGLEDLKAAQAKHKGKTRK